MKIFLEFIDSKTRKARKELDVVKRVLEKNHYKTESFLEDEDPHFFVYSPDKGLSFDGIRVYKIGNSICYRVQKEAKTQPYGRAYSLPVEDMFNDLISDDMDEIKAGTEVINEIIKEIKKFFGDSKSAERELYSAELGKEDSLGKALIGSTGTDYSKNLFSKGN